ncbi:MAG TPA: ribbon-helix-helix protein, CopG family [Acidimicrobiales bacterium]|nr:ribbon-helix-helix protein, CopG family [Acidimicrobiales bacterium]
MRRTNIYLDDRQLDLLGKLSQLRGEPVAQLVRQAVDEWLTEQGVTAVDEDEWARRFRMLLERRRRAAGEHGWSQDEIEAAVVEAVGEIRRSGQRSPSRRP